MALYHVHAAVISKGHSHGGAKGFAQYIAREGQEHGTQALRYIHRDGSIKEDPVAKGSGALPSWALTITHNSRELRERSKGQVVDNKKGATDNKLF